MKNLRRLFLVLPLIIAGQFLSIDSVQASVTAGANHTCAIDASGSFPGRVYCWGDNSKGQLGDSTFINRNNRVPVRGGMMFSTISAGSNHTCGLTTDNRVFCWGSDENGQLGNGAPKSNSNVPVLVTMPSGRSFSSISAGGLQTCAVTTKNEAYCWGHDGFGELGNGDGPSSDLPVLVTSTSKVRLVSAGWHNTCAIATSGMAFCWGNDGRGQIGDGGPDVGPNRVPTPTAVSMPTGQTFTDISVGESDHTCAVASNSRVYCWGFNAFGKLGLPPLEISQMNVPEAPPGWPSDFWLVSSGGSHTCALNRSGRVICWGDNSKGQIGTASAGPIVEPFVVGGLLETETVSSISAGGFHTCAKTRGGRVYCWGDNNSGQLGISTMASSNTPQLVF